MIKAYFFIKKNRFRKKMQIHRLLFSISFDFTTVFYLLLLFGYFGVAIYLEGDFSVPKVDLPFDVFTKDRLTSLALILPTVLVIQSFRESGLIFSSAEYTLTILPFEREKVWLLVAFEKWIKTFILYIVVGFIYYFFTDTSFLTILLFIFILLWLQVMMAPIQWKLFQMNYYWKLALLLLLIVFQIGAVFMSPLKIAILTNCSLFILALYATKYLFVGVDWKRITAAGDFAVWNMPLISQATKVKFKKDGQLGTWQRFNWWKKTFSRKRGAYHRLWYLYLVKQSGLIFQFIGALFVLLLVTSFLSQWVFYLAIALSTYMLATFLASLFRDRLQSDLVAALPWDVVCFKKTFLLWAVFMSSSLLLPMGVYVVRHFSYAVLLQLGLAVLLMYFFIHVKIERVINSWTLQ